MSENSIWYLNEDSSEAAKALWSVAESLSSQSEQNMQVRVRRSFELYRNRKLSDAMLDQNVLAEQQMTMNIGRSAVKTAHSKTMRTKPKASFLTTRGDYSLKRQAKRLEQFAAGAMDKVDFHTAAALADQHSIICGTGAVHIYREGANVCSEPVLVTELFFDPYESLMGKSRQMIRVKPVDKEVLKATYPDVNLENIRASTSKIYGDSQDRVRLTELVDVVEAWVLPPAKGMAGRHMISLQDQCLLDEPYEYDDFPIYLLYWTKPELGMYGIGLIEECERLQTWLNRSMDRLETGMNLSQSVKIIMDEGSIPAETMFSNEPVEIVLKTPGSPTPSFIPMPSVSGDTMRIMEMLYSKFYELSGITSLSAQGLKPAGLDSKPALREYIEETDSLHQPHFTQFSDMYVWAAKKLIDYAKEISEDPTVDKDFLKMQAVDGRQVLDIKWKDVNLDRDCYVIRPAPISAFSSSPAAKREEVMEMYNGGIFGLEETKRLLDMPDVESSLQREISPQVIMERIVEDILEDRQYISPEPYMNLDYSLKFMQHFYLYALAENVKEEKLQMLRQWIDECKQMMTPPAAPPSMPGMPGMPGMGGPPPPMGPEGLPPAPPSGPMAGPVEGGAPLPPEIMAAMAGGGPAGLP